MLTEYEAETMRREARRYFSVAPWVMLKSALAALALIVALIFGVDALHGVDSVQTAAATKGGSVHDAGSAALPQAPEVTPTETDTQ
jgi:hypothetical protein